MALGTTAPSPDLMAQLAGINSSNVYQNPNPSRQAFLQRAQQLAGQASNAQTARSAYAQLQGNNPAGIIAQQTAPAAGMPMGQAAAAPFGPQLALPAAPPQLALPPGTGAIPMGPGPVAQAAGAGGAGGAGIPPTALGGAGAAEGAGGAGWMGAGALGGEAAGLAATAPVAGRFSAAALGKTFGGMNVGPLGTTLGGLAPEGLGATLGPAGLGFGAGALINGVIPNEGNWAPARTVLSDAARGAGIGGTVGMMGGPFAPISVPVGALAGATLGAVMGGFSASKGKNATDKNQQQLGAAMQSLGLGEQDQQQFGAYYNLLAQQAGGGKKGGQAALAQLTPMLWQRAQDAQMQSQQANAALASQAMAQQFMQPLTQGAIDSANVAAAYQNQVAQNLPAGMRPMWEADAANRVANAHSQAANFAQQMALAPQMQGLQNYQSMQKQVANQALQPVIKQAAQQASGGTTANNSQSLASLLKK